MTGPKIKSGDLCAHLIKKKQCKNGHKKYLPRGRHFGEKFNLLPPLRKDSFSYLKSASFNNRHSLSVIFPEAVRQTSFQHPFQQELEVVQEQLHCLQ